MTISEFIGKWQMFLPFHELYHRIILFRRVPHVDLKPCGLLQFKLLEANIWKRKRLERHIKMAAKCGWLKTHHFWRIVSRQLIVES
jgi:hypothetical protein